MRPRETLGTAQTPDGGRVSLVRDASGLTIALNGLTLMAEKAHGSERAMAKVACGPLREAERPRVLVGGLGLGYTLRATLDALPPTAEVVCAELLDAIVDWHDGPLGPLADHPLRDPRVRRVGDVVRLLADRPAGAPPEWDAILLDVDNGPIPLTTVDNWWLYAAEGLAALAASLRPDGTLVVWSAGDDDRFLSRMRRAGLDAWIERFTARTGRRGRRRRGETHVLFVGRRE